MTTRFKVWTQILTLFMFSSVSYIAAEDYDVILRLPWSAEDTGIGYSTLPEGRYGPQAFHVRGDTISILDNQNRALKTFHRGKLHTLYAVPEGCDELEVMDKGYIVRDGLQSWKISSGQSPEPAQTEQASLKTVPVKTVKENNARAKVIRQTNQNETMFSIDFPERDLASVQWVGSDNAGNLYLLTEQFITHVPLKIRREVRKYDPSGNLMAALHLPSTGYAYIRNDIVVSESGLLYHALSEENGMAIMRWDLRMNTMKTYTYPESYYALSNFDAFADESRFLPDNPVTLKTDAVEDFPEVTPEEALATADTYVQLTWTCGTDNITNGLITDDYGYQVETPSWVTVGTHEKVPYKWGGFQTIDQFVDGIANGKYAGDRYTGKSSGTPSAVGVDCSGFVSRCWKLPSHYSTRMMDDAITLPYDSWEQTRPGDAAHIVGHVRLIVQHNEDGTIRLVEAAGYNWRVSYKNYSYAALSSYTPRYYINMKGTPGNIPQPRLDFVHISDNFEILWQLEETEDISAVKLSDSPNGSNWSDGLMLDINVSSYSMDSTVSERRFFKLNSIASDTDHTEGLPSDTYGAFAGTSASKILIVDGFDRTATNSGSWNSVYHPFAAEYGLLLSEMDISFETASNEALLNGTVELSDYKAVIWFVGDESTADETFNADEQDLVSAYLESGGYLFVSGSEIGWDLDYRGSSEDRAFFNTYLKADYKEDDAGSYTVNGAADTPFEGLTLHYDDGTHGVYQEDYPDALAALSGGEEAFYYANDKLAGVCFEGTFEEGTAPGKLVYLGFPFETIYQPDEKQALLERIMNFFEFDVTAIEPESGIVLSDFKLLGNYPNPFNGQTIIRYALPRRSELTLAVYNSLGQECFSDRWKSGPGAGQYRLRATTWSSGLYFYRLGTPEFGFQSGKFLIIK